MGSRQYPLTEGIYQIIAACIAHSITIQAGINMAFSTIMLPQIMPGHNEMISNITTNATGLVVDRNEASWIASLVTITTPVGSLLTGPLMDRYGRKTVCAATALPFAVSWTLVTTTTTSVYTIYVARILAGLGGGLSTAAMVYVSEISHPAIRPMLLSLTSVFVSLGILITTILGYFLAWRVVAICCGLMAATSLALILFVPESPTWFVGMRKVPKHEAPNKDLQLAEKSLRWLVRSEEEYQRELQSLVKIRNGRAALKPERLCAEEGTVDGAGKGAVEPPRRRSAWRPVGLMAGLFLLQQLSGGYVVIFYGVQIFEQIASVDLDQFSSVVILGCVRFVMAILTVFLSKTIGRRPLLMSSALGMTVSMFASALYVRFFDEGLTPSLLVLLFVFFSSYGVLVIPWTLIGEVLPLRIRGRGSGVLIASAYVLMFVTVKLFIIVLDAIGIVWVFATFGAFSFLLVLFVYFWLPETLGKTFEEIEESM